MMVEMWKIIPGYSNVYEVSSCGRIRRVRSDRGRYVGRILCGGYNPNGYHQVTLSIGGKQKTVVTHTLVARVFLGEPPLPWSEVNHKDGYKANNAATNLEWLTPSQNAQHAVALGLRHGLHGEKNGAAKLTAHNVLEIRASDELGVVLADRYGVSQQTISTIRLRQIWRHLDG